MGYVINNISATIGMEILAHPWIHGLSSELGGGPMDDYMVA